MSTPRPGRRGALLLYMIAAVGLPLSSVISSLILPSLSGMGVFAKLLITECLYYIPFIALPVALYTRSRKGLYQSYRVNGFSFGKVLLICLLAFNIFYINNNVTVLWAIPFQKMGLNIYVENLPTPGNVRDLMLYVISTAVFPAVCEEMLFRGIILNAFQASGTKFAVIMTSLLFMLLHGSPLGLPAEFIAGVVLCCIALITDSVYAAMIFHTLYNTITIMIDYLQMGEQSSDLLEAIGGLSGVFTIVFDILLIGALTAFILRLNMERARSKGMRIIERTRGEKLKGIEFVLIGVAFLSIALLYTISFIAMR